MQRCMAARLCIRGVCVAAEASQPLLPGCLWGDAAEHAAALACLSRLLRGGAARLLRNMLLDLYALCASVSGAVMHAQRGRVALLAPRSCSVESIEETGDGWQAVLGCGSERVVMRCRVERAQLSGPPHGPEGSGAGGSA